MSWHVKELYCKKTINLLVGIFTFNKVHKINMLILQTIKCVVYSNKQ